MTRLYTDKDEMLREARRKSTRFPCAPGTAAHAECAIAALNAGKHVLCEKPMAMNAAEAQAMLEAARRNNRLLMIGFVRRFGNDCAIVKDFIDQRPDSANCITPRPPTCAATAAPAAGLGDKSRSGGGPLIDLGVHVIDLTRYLMGNPKPVSIYGATFHKLGDRRGGQGRDGLSVRQPHRGREGYLRRGGPGRRHGPLRQRRGAAGGGQLQPEHRRRTTGTIELFGTKAGAKLDPGLDPLQRNQRLYGQREAGTRPTALSFNGPV